MVFKHRPYRSRFVHRRPTLRTGAFISASGNTAASRPTANLCICAHHRSVSYDYLLTLDLTADTQSLLPQLRQPDMLAKLALATKAVRSHRRKSRSRKNETEGGELGSEDGAWIMYMQSGPSLREAMDVHNLYALSGQTI